MRTAATGLIAISALALVLPGVASAHASLEHTWPGFRQRLASSPREVRLNFDQGVKALPGAVRVLDQHGRVLSTAVFQTNGGHDVVARVRPLARGPYTVRWQVLSDDGHVVSGVYTFGVRFPAPPPTEAVGASGPTTTEHVVRWAYFLALALLVGGLGFRLLVLRGPVPARYEQRFYLVVGLGAVGVINVGVAAFMLRAEDALQLPFGKLLYGDLSPIAGGTPFGQAFIDMTLGFALAAALVFLAWVLERPVLLWPAWVVALGFASGLSLSGHSAVDEGSSAWSELADWVHLSAACLWVGGLVQLVACVWPAAPELRRRAFLRFSRLATVLVALLVGAGIYLSVVRLPHLRDLWAEGYGRVLLVKLGLVSTALLWGAVHHFVVRPALERGAETGLLARLSRSLAGESAVAMAVLLAAAVLVDSKPPARPEPSPPQAALRP